MEMKQILQSKLAAMALQLKKHGSNDTPNMVNHDHDNDDTCARTKGQSIDLQRSGNAGENNDNDIDIIEGKADAAIGEKNVDTEIVYLDGEGDDDATKQTT